MEKPVVKSHRWGIAAVLFILAGILMMAVYIWQFWDTIRLGRDIAQYNQFRDFHSAFMSTVPFYIVLLLFVLGLWAYSLFVDLNNVFRPFNYQPREALVFIMVPVLNFYGLGWVITRIIRVFEHEQLRFAYRDLIHSLKLSLTTAYAGFSGLVIGLYFAFTMHVTPQIFYGTRFIGFNGVAFFLILLAAGGLVWTILQTRKIIATGLKEEFSNE